MHKFNKEILFDTFSNPKYDSFSYPDYSKECLMSGFVPENEGLITIKRLIDIERTRNDYIRKLYELMSFIYCFKEIHYDANGIPVITLSLMHDNFSKTDIHSEKIIYENFSVILSRVNKNDLKYIDKFIKSKLNIIVPICDFLICEKALIDIYYNLPNHNNKLNIEMFPTVLTITPYIKSLENIFKLEYVFANDREKLFHNTENDGISIYSKRVYEYKFTTYDWMFKRLLNKGEYKSNEIDLLNGIYVDIAKVPQYVKKRI